MAALQPERPTPDAEEERASTPLSLTCKEEYANVTDCLSEAKSVSDDVVNAVAEILASGKAASEEPKKEAAKENAVENHHADKGDSTDKLSEALRDYYTDKAMLQQTVVKVERDDEDSVSFANFVAQQLTKHMQEGEEEDHEGEEEHSSSISSTSSAPSPRLPELSPTKSDHAVSDSISGLCVTGDSSIDALKVPVEDCISMPFDMTSRNFPKRSKYAHRAAISAMHPYNRTRGGGVSIAKTLELLKAVLQTSFNQEVKRLCDDYLEIYKLASTNIYNNTGEVVPKETLRTLVCKMLDESGQCYQNSKYELTSGKLPRNEKVMEKSGSPMASRKHKMDREMPKRQIKKPKRIPVDKYERS